MKPKDLVPRDAAAPEAGVSEEELFAHFSSRSVWYPLALMGRTLRAHGPFWATLALLPVVVYLGLYMMLWEGWIEWRLTQWVVPPLFYLTVAVAARGARRTLTGDRCLTVREVVAEAPARLLTTTALLWGWTTLCAYAVIPLLGAPGFLVSLWFGVHLLGERTVREDGAIRSLARTFQVGARRLVPRPVNLERFALVLLVGAFWLCFESVVSRFLAEWVTLGIFSRILVRGFANGIAFLGATMNCTHLYLAWDLQDRRLLDAGEAPPEGEAPETGELPA